MTLERVVTPKPPRRGRKKKSPKQAASELQIEKRREKVSELRVGGNSIRAIATKLRVSVGTVHSDIAAVFERVKEKADDHLEQERAISLARMEVATKGLMKAVKKGSTTSVDSLVKVETRRAKLLGLDAPEKHELGGKDGGPIEVSAKSALEQKLNGLKSRLRPEPAEPSGTAGSQPH